jgi:hypothetical protein
MRIVFLLILATFQLSGQVLPVQFRSDWIKSGIEGDFTEPATLIGVTSFGAIPDDGLSDDAALNSAISSVTGLTTIYFPPGAYHFSATVNIPDSIVLKGAGADSTFFVFDLSNAQLNCINLQGSADPVFQPLSGGYLMGSDYLVCTNAGAFFSAGDYIEMRQLNGTWDSNPASWAEYSVGHLSRITSVSNDTIFLADALRISFDAALNPEIRKLYPVKNAGLECFRLSRTDSLATGTNYGIQLSRAWNCRIRGIESYKSIGAHVIAEVTAHCEIRDSYFQEAYTYEVANTRGYGVVMGVHSCANKIENSVFRKLRHAMMVKQGANGNVFGYNYSREVQRTEFPSNASGDISVHGHYPFANLFEGNVCQNITVDQAWGPSGPRNVFFRNRAELYGFIITSGTVQSDSQAVAGNTISSTAPFTGFYLFNGIGHFTYANSVQGTIQPSGTSVLVDSSCYLDSVPAFMYTLSGFPPIGTSGSGAETNAAKLRYTNGEPPARCGEAISTGKGNPIIQNLFQVNYQEGAIVIGMEKSPEATIQSLLVTDLSGRVLLNFYPDFNLEAIRHFIPFKLNQGIYFLTISGVGFRKTVPFLVN